MHEISAVAVVGEGISTAPDASLQIVTALKEQGINTRYENKSGIRHLLYVDKIHAEAAARTIYNRFFNNV